MGTGLGARAPPRREGPAADLAGVLGREGPAKGTPGVLVPLADSRWPPNCAASSHAATPLPRLGGLRQKAHETELLLKDRKSLTNARQVFSQPNCLNSPVKWVELIDAALPQCMPSQQIGCSVCHVDANCFKGHRICFVFHTACWLPHASQTQCEQLGDERRCC